MWMYPMLFFFFVFDFQQGKTLAFVLPILESLTNGPTKASRKTGYGRTPSVLVLLPTRELATQVLFLVTVPPSRIFVILDGVFCQNFILLFVSFSLCLVYYRCFLNLNSMAEHWDWLRVACMGGLLINRSMFSWKGELTL